MDKLKICIPTFLAVFITIAVFGVIYILIFKELPAGNKEIIFTSFGIVLGKMGSIIDFFFGSSHGSEKKTDALIAQSNDNKPKEN